jgi:hypothetical protein
MLGDPMVFPPPDACDPGVCPPPPDAGASDHEWLQYERHLERCTQCQRRLDAGEELGGRLIQLARETGDPTARPPDPVLSHYLTRLRTYRSPLHVDPSDPIDLYFLRPSDRPDVLGMLDGYEVQQVIGQGGMGTVLKAYDPPLHRLVAIKVMAPALAGSAIARARFTREAQAAAAISHDHVVVVHGVHATNGLPYLVMEYIGGESLQERLDRAGPMELTELVRIAYQTASGLAAAHAQGLIHRDIKPANLLLENGLARVTITDFGLARLVDDVGLTQNGAVAGTPEYMSPEQAHGDAIDHRADLFSLGSVMYAMATGVPPFQGSTALAVLRHVSEQTPPPVQSLNPAIPAWLETFVARLMAKDPGHRFQSAAEVATLLEGYLAHLRQPLAIPAPPLRAMAHESTQVVRGKRWCQYAWALGTAVAVLAIMAGVRHLLQLNGNGPPAQAPAADAGVFYQDFRGKPVHPALRWSGTGGDEVIEADERGLRIQLPANRTRKEPVGIAMLNPLQGDFEAVAGYELLDMPQPRRGGIGFEMYISLATAADDAIVLHRQRHPNGADQYLCGHFTTVDGKRRYDMKFFPTEARAGSLRVARKGSEFTLSASEGDGGPFQELLKGDWSDGDVKMIRVGVSTSHWPEPVDVRLLDLKVQSDHLDPDFATDLHAVAAPLELGSRTWLILAVAVAVLFILAVAGSAVMALAARRRGKPAPTTAGSPDQPSPANAGATSVAIAYTCPGCGKRLKVKPELVGKKVKCPSCGNATMSPGQKRA